jgi:tripartite-type tricarboxylate transporter receptor subunit TctC
MKELLDAMKAKPGQITVATAGVTSGGHNAMEAIARAAGVQYRHVTYDGGNPAVIATVAGETQVTTQLAVEQAEMIRGKRIRPLATVSDRPIEIEGHGAIEAITRTVPGMKIPTNYFGIFIPRGVPQDVASTVDRVWRGEIMRSEALKTACGSRASQACSSLRLAWSRPHSSRERWCRAGHVLRSPQHGSPRSCLCTPTSPRTCIRTASPQPSSSLHSLPAPA